MFTLVLFASSVTISASNLECELCGYSSQARCDLELPFHDPALRPVRENRLFGDEGRLSVRDLRKAWQS